VLPSVGDKTPQISLSRGVVLSQSTFHLVIVDIIVVVVVPVQPYGYGYQLASHVT